MRYFYLIFVSVLFGATPARAQFTADDEKYLDSLAYVAEHETEDSIVLNALLTWDDFIYAYDRDLDYDLNKRIVAIVQQGLNKPGINDRYRQIYLRSYSIAQNNIGLLLMDDEEFLSALKCFQLSLQIAEHYQDSMKIGNALNNIGMIYEHLKLNEKAIEYYTESHSYDKADLISTGSYYNNIALCYMDMGDTMKAFELLTISLAYSDSADDFRGIGNTHSNLGIIYLGWNQPEEALIHFEQSVEAYNRGESGSRPAMSYKGIGLAYLDLENYSKAIEFCQKAYEIALQTESVLAQKESCYCLYEANKKSGNTARALQYHEDYVTHRNALEDAEKRVELLKTDFQFNLDRQHLQDSLTYSNAQQLERERFETKLEKKQTTQYVLFAGILFFIILGAFILRSYFRKKKDAEIISNQKREVELQKQIVEEKNKEITDSINYAKRIQDAILPSTILLENTFKDCFVYYKPKDIIAGDFYWLEKKNNLVFFAVADCTGHGVPGAMVSVVCHNALNRAVNEFNLINPGNILDKTRELVIETFEQKEGRTQVDTIRDGMDITLCVWHTDQQKLFFSGANNSLYLVRKNKLTEYHADSQPIGNYAEEKPFNTIEIQLEPDDLLYLYTDGYADQFGGPDGKKFKYKKLKDLLLSIAPQSVNQQKQQLDTTFENWKGNLEQVDDVCVMAVSIV